MSEKTTETASSTKKAIEETTYVVKTFTQLGAETMGKILTEAEKGMARAYEESDRMFHESVKLGEAQLKASQDLVEAMMDGARRLQKVWG